jgi:transcriptional regulator with XRE-family HTH domain
MPFSQDRQFPALIDNLKVHLKAQGLRQRDIADRLGVGLATVKRWLAGDGLTTRRLEDLCDLAKIELFELVEMTARGHSGKAERFTPSQERALGKDPRLFFIFFSLLNGWPPEECERELRISHQTMQGELQLLARLGLIDVLSGGRIRVLTTRMVSWRKDGPVAKHFEARQSFVDIENADGAMTMSDFVRLTDAAVVQVRRLTDELRREIHRIAQVDRHDPELERIWYGVLFFARPLNMPAIRNSISDTREGTA